MSTNASGQQKRPRKERAQLSCSFCRHRKLKCDRSQPCQNCIKRNQESTCSFATVRDGRIEKTYATDSAAVQKRVQHLEDLVVGLMSSQNGTDPTSIQARNAVLSIGPGSSPTGLQGDIVPDTTQSDRIDPPGALEEDTHALQAFGKMQVSGPNLQYVGNEHWTAILDDIAEVKKHISAEDGSPDSSQDVDQAAPTEQGPDLLLGVGRAYSKQELLEELPSKADVDRLVSRYFNSPDPLVSVIHIPTFQLDYERFWTNPDAAPTSWLALLYSVMSQASFFQRLTTEQASDQATILQEDINTYRQLAAQSLIASNYTQPVRWTLEALMMYLMNEYTRTTDTQIGLWVVLGVLIRLAMRLGYHRDADGFPQVSVFQGEMRRRIWAIAVQLDLLSSVQFGLPRAIRQTQSDTRLPGNYIDGDLYESMTALPPPRPDSEYTLMSYHIFKGRLTRWVGKISDEASAMQAATYEHILQLDAELTKEFEAMPAKLRTKTLISSITDSPGLIMKRFNIDLLYHKAICTLHRRYVALARTNERYMISRTRSMRSAKIILSNQIIMYEVTQPGGRVYEDRWLISGLTTEDFTLAAMVLCLNLETSSWGVETSDALGALKEKQETYELIERSYDIWNVWKEQPGLASFKAKKAVQVLGVMLRKIKPLISTEEIDGPATSSTAATTGSGSMATEEFSASYTDGTPATSNMSVDAAYMFMTPDVATDPDGFQALAPITGWIDAPQDIDWEQWDDLFQPIQAIVLPDDVWLPMSYGGDGEAGGAEYS